MAVRGQNAACLTSLKKEKPQATRVKYLNGLGEDGVTARGDAGAPRGVICASQRREGHHSLPVAGSVLPSTGIACDSCQARGGPKWFGHGLGEAAVERQKTSGLELVKEGV